MRAFLIEEFKRFKNISKISGDKDGKKKKKKRGDKKKEKKWSTLHQEHQLILMISWVITCFHKLQYVIMHQEIVGHKL